MEWNADAAKRAPVFLAGDSHCLTAAWRAVTLRGERRTLVPLLTTGLKAWHLRAASRFYPKVQFWNSLAKLPAGAQLVMAFGEIDCREGMLVRPQPQEAEWSCRQLVKLRGHLELGGGVHPRSATTLRGGGG